MFKVKPDFSEHSAALDLMMPRSQQPLFDDIGAIVHRKWVAAAKRLHDEFLVSPRKLEPHEKAAIALACGCGVSDVASEGTTLTTTTVPCAVAWIPGEQKFIVASHHNRLAEEPIVHREFRVDHD